MKKSLSAGLLIFLPLFLTFVVVQYLFNWFITPFTNVVSLEEISPTLAHHLWALYLFQGFVLISMIGFIVLLGFFAETLILRMLINGTLQLLNRVPIINKIYQTSRHTISSLFSSTHKTSLRPVYVPFGSSKQRVIGFVIENNVHHPLIFHNNTEYVSVLVPETPNPTVGFMLLYPKESIQYSHLTVDNALQLILTCGTSIN